MRGDARFCRTGNAEREYRQPDSDARSDAMLTQKQLADLIGTKQPVIARLDACLHSSLITQR